MLSRIKHCSQFSKRYAIYIYASFLRSLLRPSVCLSVCHIRAWAVSRVRRFAESINTTRLGTGSDMKNTAKIFATVVFPGGCYVYGRGTKKLSFQPILVSHFISEMIQIGPVAMEDNRNSYAIYQMMLFSVILNDPKQRFQMIWAIVQGHEKWHRFDKPHVPIVFPIFPRYFFHIRARYLAGLAGDVNNLPGNLPDEASQGDLLGLRCQADPTVQ